MPKGSKFNEFTIPTILFSIQYFSSVNSNEEITVSSYAARPLHFITELSSSGKVGVSNNSNLDTPTSNNINTNAAGLTADGWRDDIEKVKLKIRNSIKRKSEETANLQKRSRVLEQM